MESSYFNKTVVASIAIGAVAFTVTMITVSYFYFSKGMEKVMPMDKFTTCLKTIMSESRQSNKAISGNEASEICKNMFMKDR